MGNSSSGSRLTYGWDVGSMKTPECEDRLTTEGSQTGDFLVRFSKQMNGNCLSIRSGPNKVKHFPITKHFSNEYSIEEEWGEFAAFDSPIKEFKFESIEAMLEGFLRGGPCAKIAYHHFGCFLLRVSPKPTTKQHTTPPSAFAAQPVFGGFRSSNNLLTGKAHALPPRPPRTSDGLGARTMSMSSDFDVKPSIQYRSGSQISRSTSGPVMSVDYTSVIKTPPASPTAPTSNVLFGQTIAPDQEEYDKKRREQARRRSLINSNNLPVPAPVKANEAEDAYHLSGSFKDPNKKKDTGSYADTEFNDFSNEIDPYSDPHLEFKSNRDSHASEGEWAGSPEDDDEEEATGFGSDDEEEEITGFG